MSNHDLVVFAKILSKYDVPQNREGSAGYVYDYNYVHQWNYVKYWYTK